MCLSNNRDVPVVFANTILLAAQVQIDGETRHLCGYYNKVSGANAPTQLLGSSALRSRALAHEAPQDLSSEGPDFGYDVPVGSATQANKAKKTTVTAKAPAVALGNAMLIAIPAKPGTVSGGNLIPVGDYPSFMTDYARAVMPQRPRIRGSLGGGGLLGVEVVSNFDNGTYDVIIADSAEKIVKAIDLVAEAKRPKVNADLYAQLDKLYPQWTFLLFCFSEATAAKAGCALVSYVPMPAFEHMLYLPGLDGHSGTIEQGLVELNHTIVLGSDKMLASAGARSVTFSESAIEKELPFLPRQVIGHTTPSGMKAPQGDFLFSLEDVVAGKFRALRSRPPGWKAVFGGEDKTPFYITPNTGNMLL